jgi:class 3 adenylate cyclase
VTILFTDFVGFTLSTEKLAVEELVDMLHDYFTAFDQIVARYGLEKMKTIGDSYMCISGLPVRNPAHPVDMVMAAFEMLHAVQERSRADRPVQWQVRIGIHTGPVIAGVVGINKFAFDIWGDTVNYSSRMESSGEANRINLSERTYSRVKDFFACQHRGKVLTKEKRELDMYFANGILPGLVNGSVKTPPPAFVRRYNVYFQKDPPSFPGFLIGEGQQEDSPVDSVIA